MVKLTKIYTKTGDEGRTSLGDGSRVGKTDARVEAYGSVDEANAFVGEAITRMGDGLKAVREELLRVQQDLFDVGADLCVAGKGDEGDGKLRVTVPQVERLEGAIDGFNGSLEALDSFVLPGGTRAAAGVHVARVVVRRAERRVLALAEDEGHAVNPLVVVYLNRLSDLLFVMGRVANGGGKGDVLWVPGANR